jgi:hypothetical protein
MKQVADVRSSCLARPPGDWRINPRLAADPVFQDWSDPAREREKLRTASGDVDIEDSVMEPYTVSASFAALK